MRDSTHSAAVLPEKFADLPGRMQGFAQRIINRSGLTGRFGDPVEDSKWSAVSPTTMARNADLDVLKSLRIYFDAGTDDRYDLAPLNQELSRILGQREVSHAFELVEGGGHSWGSGALQAQLPKSLGFVGAAFRGQDPAKPAASRPASRPQNDR